METGAAPEPLPAAAPDAAPTLLSQLKALASLFSQDEITLGEVFTRLGTSASGWIVLLLALPFCAPVTIPGLSTPFGLVIAVIATRSALGLSPWLPKRLLSLKLPPRFFKTVTEGAGRFVRWIEKRLHPRWSWLTGTDARLRFHYWSLCVSALLLALPLGGIPLTNTLPGLAVFVGMIGIMERDGLAILLSYLILLATIIYFVCFAAVLIEVMQHVIVWWRG